MHKKIPGILLLLALILAANCLQAQTKKKAVKKATTHTTKRTLPKKAVVPVPVADMPEIRVKITTSLGDIVVKLSNKTPKHRDNFIKLVNEHFYDSTLFHRVINS